MTPEVAHDLEHSGCVVCDAYIPCSFEQLFGLRKLLGEQMMHHCCVFWCVWWTITPVTVSKSKAALLQLPSIAAQVLPDDAWLLCALGEHHVTRWSS